MNSKHPRVKRPRNNYFIYSLLVMQCIIGGFCEPNMLVGQILNISLIGLCFWQIIKYYRLDEFGMVIFYFFILSYSIVPFVYFFLGENINIRTRAQNIKTVYDTLLYTYLFIITLSFFLNPHKKSKRAIYLVGTKKSLIIFSFCILGALVCMIKGKSGANIFSSGGYGNTISTLEVSSMFGYGILFILCALIYANTSRKIKIVILTSMLYVVRDLMFGGRIDSIMLILILFIMYFRFILSKKKILTYMILGFFFMKSWEVFRSMTDGNLISMLNSGSVSAGFISGNASDVYYASMRIIDMIDKNLLTISDRILSGFYFLLSIVIPYNKLPDLANLSSYMPDYNSGGGGLAPIFMFAMYGVFGVIVFAMFIGKKINNMLTGNCGQYGYVYGVLLIATVPRWFAYYPINAIKYCLYGVVILLVLNTWNYLEKNSQLFQRHPIKNQI